MKSWKLERVPKILHLYWGKNKKLSYLKFLTVQSFSNLNPDWEIKVHHPLVTCKEETWPGTEQKGTNYLGNDFFNSLDEIKNVELVEVDFQAMGILNEISEVFKSDLIRTYILSKVGGVWSDFDIFYIKPITESSFNIDENINKSSYFCCFQGLHRIGFLASSASNQLFEKLFLKACDSFVKTNYQSLGSAVFNREFSQAIPDGAVNIGMECVYPYDWYEGNRLYEPDDKVLDKNTIGIHWSSGWEGSSAFDNEVTPENIDSFSKLKLFKEILG